MRIGIGICMWGIRLVSDWIEFVIWLLPCTKDEEIDWVIGDMGGEGAVGFWVESWIGAILGAASFNIVIGIPFFC